MGKHNLRQTGTKRLVEKMKGKFPKKWEKTLPKKKSLPKAKK